MWEMGMACGLPKPSRSLHLCEAPGGFVEACVDMYPECDWRAASIAEGPRFASHSVPRNKVVSDDDIRMSSSRDDLVRRVVHEWTPRVVSTGHEWPKSADGLDEYRVDLVTADGAAPMDHDRIEDESADLVEAETDVAMRVLDAGGTFILKIFEGGSPRSLHLLARLCEAFEDVALYKPTLSRPTNSERYVVCRSFGGRVVNSVHLDVEWASKTMRVVDAMCDEQAEALREALARVQVIKRRR
jgi:23S rRNA U2552 (ribose-2'-O)-methylase RlmE/FtsJ